MIQQKHVTKNAKKALLLEKIDPTAAKILTKAGFKVEKSGDAFSGTELKERVKDLHVLGIRSKTSVEEESLAGAKELLAIGAYCIGTNQIDLDACRSKGIAVFNAPFSNTRSVVELTMGNIIMLLRKAFDKSRDLHAGVWDKSANGCHEVRGKTLGLIGYGNIGTQLSVLAEGFGMRVCYYDIAEKLTIGNAYKCATLSELLGLSDIVSVHVDGRKENDGFIGEKEFTQMKKGVYFLNMSRGSVVDIDDLATGVRKGHIAGVAVDVYPQEPKGNSETFITPLQNLPNVILTPHVGAGTYEAQEKIAEFVTSKLLKYINAGSTSMSVNMPRLDLPHMERVHRIVHIHKNVPGVLANINKVLAKAGVNIQGQYLKTDEDIGYVVTDVNRQYKSALLRDLAQVPHTIRTRILY